MTESEFFERIDAHLAMSNDHMGRGNEHMARGNQIMARSNEIMAGSTEIMAGSKDLIQEHREFIRELTRRNEVVTRELVREVSAGREVLLDVHRESYAQREAIWALIDELRSKGLGGGD